MVKIMYDYNALKKRLEGRLIQTRYSLDEHYLMQEIYLGLNKGTHLVDRKIEIALSELEYLEKAIESLDEHMRNG